MESSLLCGNSFVFGVLFASFTAACGQFILTPINQAVVAGDKVKFQWQLEINLTRWTWSILKPSSIGSIENIVRSSSQGIISRFSDNFSHFRFLSDENRSCVMSTEAVKPEDGGNYTLEYGIGEWRGEFAVQLTVLETLPLCKNRSLGGGESAAVELSCSVNFSGFWAPIMTWQTVLSNGQTVDRLHADDAVFHSRPNNYDRPVVTSSSSSSSSSAVVVSVDRLRNISCVRCKTHFVRSEGDRIVTNAANNPSFVYTWKWSPTAGGSDDDFCSAILRENDELPLTAVILVVASVVLILGFGLVVVIIIRRSPQTRCANSKHVSCAEYRNGSRKSNSVVVLTNSDHALVEEEEETVSPDEEEERRIYVNLEPSSSRNSFCGEANELLSAIRSKTLPIYEDIGHAYSTLALTWQSQAEEKEAETEEAINFELQNEWNASEELMTHL